jgi:hypothetical protein
LSDSLILHHADHFSPNRKNRKTYGSVLVRFFEEKCILRPFSGLPKQSNLQPARYEAFTKGAKTGHLYDTDAFTSGTAADHFSRNLLRINQMALKSAQPEGRQKRVTYNNMPFAKPEKRGFLAVS